MRQRFGWFFAGFLFAGVVAAGSYFVWSAQTRLPTYKEYHEFLSQKWIPLLETHLKDEGLELEWGRNLLEYFEAGFDERRDLIRTNSLRYPVVGIHEYAVRADPKVSGSREALQKKWLRYTKYPDRPPPQTIRIREEIGYEGRGSGYMGSGWYYTKRELIE